jgi:hypothetical protein
MFRLVQVVVVLAIIAALGSNLGCNPVLMVAPPGTTIKVIVNPPFISAHGGVSVITAILIESTGVPVADGTVVQFFTNLGRIDEQGRTNDGVARVNLVADGRSGTATITAFSGGGSTSGSTTPTTAPTTAPTTTPTTGTPTPGTGGGGVNTPGDGQVFIGNISATQVLLSAVPNRVVESRAAVITATVLDKEGNPVPNVPVFFSVTDNDGNASTERMDSGGNPVFTDNNGRAQDILRTRADPGGSPHIALVQVRTANGITATNPLRVTIN